MRVDPSIIDSRLENPLTEVTFQNEKSICNNSPFAVEGHSVCLTLGGFVNFVVIHMGHGQERDGKGRFGRPSSV